MEHLEYMREYLSGWFTYDVMGVNISQVVITFVCVLAGLVLKKLSDIAFHKKIISFLKRSRWEFDNMIAEAASRPVGWMFVIGGFSTAFSIIRLPEHLDHINQLLSNIIKIAFTFNIVWFLYRCVDVIVEHLEKLAERTESKLDDQLVPLVRKALKITIGVVAFMWTVQLLGYSVTSLLAGLGVGGLAVALALQDTLANVFGSIVLFIDRPFSVGDWIKIGDSEGIVENIGFRSTLIRTWEATVISIPNKQVADSVIDNWSKMPKRRVRQTVGVTYETTPVQMEKAVAAIRDIIESDDGVNKDLIVVRFTEFGPSTLDIMVRYFTNR